MSFRAAFLFSVLIPALILFAQGLQADPGTEADLDPGVPFCGQYLRHHPFAILPILSLIPLRRTSSSNRGMPPALLIWCSARLAEERSIPKRLWRSSSSGRRCRRLWKSGWDQFSAWLWPAFSSASCTADIISRWSFPGGSGFFRHAHLPHRHMERKNAGKIKALA